MNFHQRNKNFLARDNNKKIWWIIVIFFIFLFSFSWTRNLIFTVGTPFWYAKNAVNNFISNNVNFLTSKKELIKQNLSLTEQAKNNEKDYALLNLLKKENEELKSILSRKKEDQKFLLASVLVKPFLSPYDTLIVDAGSSLGVAVGDKVIAEGNIFIGSVYEVYGNTSKVVLYSSPGEKIKVLVGNNNVEKEAVGLGGGNFKIEMPSESDVKEGDSIIIPSISSNIFGVVEKVENKKSDPFQTVLFKNPMNIAELKWVEIILSNKK